MIGLIYHDAHRLLFLPFGFRRYGCRYEYEGSWKPTNLMTITSGLRIISPAIDEKVPQDDTITVRWEAVS